MKKTYVYFLVPLIGLIAFGAVYWNFNSEFEAKEEAKKAAIRKAKEDKLREEAKNREIAIKDALAAQERRKRKRRPRRPRTSRTAKSVRPPLMRATRPTAIKLASPSRSNVSKRT
ncbi:MAG: hypothetical protein NVV63_09610 [Opitutus sp.]|nr:hypothetical protein [Opitutus sp.]